METTCTSNCYPRVCTWSHLFPFQPGKDYVAMQHLLKKLSSKYFTFFSPQKNFTLYLYSKYNLVFTKSSQKLIGLQNNTHGIKITKRINWHTNIPIHEVGLNIKKLIFHEVAREVTHQETTWSNSTTGESITKATTEESKKKEPCPKNKKSKSIIQVSEYLV